MFHDGPGNAAARPSHGPGFWVLTTLAAVIAVAGIAAGAFLLGQSTRPSDGEVADRLARQASAAEASYGRREQDRLAAQRTDLRAQFRRKMNKAVETAQVRGQEAGWSSGHQAGYSTGQSEGYSSGAAEGRAEGEEEGREEGKREGKRAGERQGRREGREEGEVDGYLDGFDDGTCYDPDTYAYVC